jgi:hypothetical protein
MTITSQELDFLKSVNQENCGDYNDSDWDCYGNPVKTAETIDEFKNSAFSFKGIENFKSESGLEFVTIKNFQRYKGDQRRDVRIADFGNYRLVLA